MGRLFGTIGLVAAAALGREVPTMTESIHWLGHDTFCIDGSPVVYLDPYKLAGTPRPADFILITHEHFDHCSPEDVARIRTPKTVVVGPREVVAKLPPPVVVIAAGETKTFAGLTVRAVPAYNTNKTFHTKDSGKLGYVVTVGGITCYHAGDTDLIPEMTGLAPDVALLPVSGTYVMTAGEAAEAARRIKPKVAIPMHYGSVVGTDVDAKKFAKLLDGSGITVVIKAKE